MSTFTRFYKPLLGVHPPKSEGVDFTRWGYKLTDVETHQNPSPLSPSVLVPSVLVPSP